MTEISKEPAAYQFAVRSIPEITFVGYEKSGYASRGCRAHTEDGEYFVLQGPPDIYKAQRVGLHLPHSPVIHGVYGESPTHTIMDAVPITSRPLLDVLKTVGLHTIQTESTKDGAQTVSDDHLHALYSHIISSLAELHISPCGDVFSHVDKRDIQKKDVVRLREEAMNNIVTDSQRLDGIAAIALRDENSIPTRQGYNALRRVMIRLGEQESQYTQRLSVVHGDAWAANIFVPKNDEIKPVHFIDPAILFSDPALDVVFSLFDIAAIYGHSGSLEQEKYLKMADELVDVYIQKTRDGEIRKHMALFYGYKSFVSAVFDIQDPERKQDVFHAGLGAVIQALQTGGDFHFSQFNEYKKAGEHYQE